MTESVPEAAYKIAAALEKARRPLLTSHIRLDGDAIGSELALAQMVALRGAAPHVVNDGRVPKLYTFLPGADTVGATVDALRGDYDLVLCLDIPQRSRAGEIFAHLPDDIPVAAIDHHLFVEPVGDPEWRDTGISSTGEMVYRLAVAAGWRIPAEAATCLYAALLTDTGRFTFPNTTPSAMRCAARLMELGADTVRIAEEVYENDPPAVLALRAETIQSLRLHADGRIAVMMITRDMLTRHGVSPVDMHAFSDIPRGISGVRVGVLLMALDGEVKVSLRSRAGINVAPVARGFGGGGHPQAAGCEIAGDLVAAEQAVVAALGKHLDREGE